MVSILGPLYTAMAYVLAFFYEITHNYVISIVLLTVVVMLVITPLTVKGTRSMLQMQKLAPEMKKIQAEHKNDREAMNAAMMAFYKEHGVNPLGGCLPLLLQMPVFFVLVGLIHGLTRTAGHGADLVGKPRFVQPSSQLYHDLAAGKGKMVTWGFDLSKSALGGHSSFAVSLPYFVLVAAMIFVSYYQQRQITNRNPQAAAANPQAQMMTKIFPIFFGVISLNIAAGVVVYWLASGAFRIFQQWAMYRFDPTLAESVKRNVAELEGDIDRNAKGKGRTKPGRKGVDGPEGGDAGEAEGEGGRGAGGSKVPRRPKPQPGGGGAAARPVSARDEADGSRGARPGQARPAPAASRRRPAAAANGQPSAAAPGTPDALSKPGAKAVAKPAASKAAASKASLRTRGRNDASTAGPAPANGNGQDGRRSGAVAAGTAASPPRPPGRQQPKRRKGR